jgi:hypothetical protein
MMSSLKHENPLHIQVVHTPSHPCYATPIIDKPCEQRGNVLSVPLKCDPNLVFMIIIGNRSDARALNN